MKGKPPGQGPGAVSGTFDGPVPALLAKLSLPVLAGTALQLLYGIVDTLWVSRRTPATLPM